MVTDSTVYDESRLAHVPPQERKPLRVATMSAQKAAHPKLEPLARECRLTGEIICQGRAGTLSLLERLVLEGQHFKDPVKTLKSYALGDVLNFIVSRFRLFLTANSNTQLLSSEIFDGMIVDRLDKLEDEINEANRQVRSELLEHFPQAADVIAKLNFRIKPFDFEEKTVGQKLWIGTRWWSKALFNGREPGTLLAAR